MNATQLSFGGEIAAALASLDEAGIEYEIICSGEQADCLSAAA